MNDLLTVSELTKRFTSAAPPVVDRADFSVMVHEIFALLGPSGCGKTTMLRLIAGFERADAGRIYLDGQTLVDTEVEVQPEARGIGFVFQEHALFPHLDVLQNVAFGLRALPRKARRDRAMEVLALVGLETYTHRKPHELSGGEQQRVAVARAVAPKPKLILLDEPFSSLDAVLRRDLREEVRSLLKTAGMSAILVTHDQEEALSFADRLGVMRQGRIEQIGTPEAVYDEPATPFVAQFLGRMNVLNSHARGLEANTPLGVLQLNQAAEGPTPVFIRPEHLTLEAQSSSARHSRGVIVGRDFNGHDITYRVDVKDVTYLVHTESRLRFKVGDVVYVRSLAPGIVLKHQG